MLPVGAKSSVTAVEGEPGVTAAVWFVGVPVQSMVGYRWKITLPVGFGTPAGVPAVRVTNALSCTTVPATTVVTTPPVALRMSVRTLSSAHSFAASALSPAFESPLCRCIVTPPTVTSVAALIVVVPVVEEPITTVHEPEPPAVVQLLGPTKLAGPDGSEKLIVVPFGAFAKPPEPLFTFT